MKRQEITTKVNHMEYAHHHQPQLAQAVVAHASMARNSIAHALAPVTIPWTCGCEACCEYAIPMKKLVLWQPPWRNSFT